MIVAIIAVAWIAVGLLLAWGLRNDPQIPTRSDQLGVVIFAPIWLLAMIFFFVLRVNEWLEKPAIGRMEPKGDADE